MEIEAKTGLEALSKDELMDRYDSVRRKVMTLEWDKKHNQINSGMEARYEELRKDFDSLKERVRIIKEVEAKEELSKEMAAPEKENAEEKVKAINN